MSHEYNTGFTVREPAWHRLSFTAERNPESLDELLEWTFCYNADGKIPGADIWEPVYAGLLTTAGEGRCESRQDECREPATYEVHLPNGKVANGCEKHAQRARAKRLTITPLPTVVNDGWQAIKRSDNGHLLHVSKTSFETIRNREAAEFLMMMLDYAHDLSEDEQMVLFGPNGIKYETGMVLKNGGMVVFCVSMDIEEQVPGDPSGYRAFSSIHNYHDGSGALKAQNTSWRVLCANTASAAEMEGEKSGRQYSWRHSKNIRENIEAGLDALKNGRSETKQWIEYGTECVNIPVDDGQFEEWLDAFVPEDPLASKRAKNNVMNTRQSIRNLYHTSPTIKDINGTAWGVINAAGEYLDHKRRYRTPETYVARTMLKSEDGKHKAMELIADVVGYDNDELLTKVTA